MIFAALLLAASIFAVKQAPKTLQIGILKRIPEAECTRKVEKYDKVAIHLTNTIFESGLQVDSTKNSSPFEFVVGTYTEVPKGVEQGILQMCIGEKRRLIIPPNLAYADRGRGKIPPDSTLIFEIEVVDILTPEIKKEL